MTAQSFRILPTSKLGKWSLVFIIAMPILFIIGTSFTNTLYQSVQAGDNIWADISARPALALTLLAGMIAGISAFISGITAIIMQKDRAFLTYVSCSIGALVILALTGNFLFPG